MLPFSTIRNIALLSISIPCLCFGQWSQNPAVNTPVCTATDQQIDLRMMADANGGAFIAWKDYRNVVPDIYLQHIDKNGQPLWAADGVVVCNDPADQSTPALTTDMHGGVIVAWSDWRSNIERDVYAQRIDSNGHAVWAVNGVGVATKQEREHNEKIISDEAGGAIVVWEQQSFFTGQWDIWAQRIDSTGAAKWVLGGLPVTTTDANRQSPKMQKDGKGGAFVTWQDYRNGTDYDIYAQHLSSNGTLLWGGAAKAICTAGGAQTNPKIDGDSSSRGIFIGWVDKRNGLDYDLYAQRIDSAGTILWAANGAPAVTATGNQSALDMLGAADADGVIVTWKDNRNGNDDIYAQRLNPAGVAQWGLNGVAICNSLNPQVNPNIVTDKSGGAIIVWQDSLNGNWDVRSQRINNAGLALWQTNGLWIGDATNAQTSPKNVSDGNGGSIYAFQDSRSGTDDIYAHHIFASGTYTGLQSITTANLEMSCYPNPSAAEFVLVMALSEATPITARLYNVLGQQVAELITGDEPMKAGKQTIRFGASLLPGVYFLNLSGQDFSKSMELIKTR